MKSLFFKNKNLRYIFTILEKKKFILNYICQNRNLNFNVRSFAFFELQFLMVKYSNTKIRNRCLLTNRSRSIYRFCKISRLFLKKFALEGHLIGIKKASW